MGCGIGPGYRSGDPVATDGAPVRRCDPYDRSRVSEKRTSSALAGAPAKRDTR